MSREPDKKEHKRNTPREPETVHEAQGQFASVLEKDFAAGLNDYVSEKYEELWELAQRPQGEF